jgi:hypothetical protein
LGASIAGKPSSWPRVHVPALRHDAHHGAFDLVELRAAGALAIPRPVVGAAGELVEQVHGRPLACDVSRPGRHFLLVGNPHVEKLRGIVDAALVADVAVEIDRAVALADAPEVRRLRAGGLILAPAEVGIADHADIAVAPRLRRDPLDEIVAVGALLLVEPLPLAFGEAAAAALCDHVHVALGDVERGRARLDGVAPVRRLALVVVRVGRARQQRRIAAVLLRRVDIGGKANAVAHGDADVLFEPHARRRLRRGKELLRVCQRDFRLSFACHVFLVPLPPSS